MRKRILCGLMAVIMVAGCWACNKDVTIGDFVFRDGALIYLSDSGQQKEVIYVPEEMNGKTITRLGHNGIIGSTTIRSEKLKKMYLPITIAGVNNDFFAYLDRFEAAFLPGIETHLDNNMGARRIYISKFRYDCYKKFRESLAPANIAYLYGYEGCPNEGYYFIDNLKETGKLVKPPVDPVREGYIFYGWYLQETGRIFDFINDEITVETDEEGKPIYKENVLVAKWVEKYN